MKLLLCLLIMLRFTLAADPCVCECKFEEHHARRLEEMSGAQEEWRRALANSDAHLGHIRRKLDTIGDISLQLSDMATQVGSISDNMYDVQTNLIDLRDDVIDSAINMTNEIGDKINGFVEYVVDEVDVAKENVVSGLSSFASGLLYGIIGMLGGIIFITFMSACIPWCLRLNKPHES